MAKGATTAHNTQKNAWTVTILWLVATITRSVSKVLRCTRQAAIRALDTLLIYTGRISLTEEEILDRLLGDISDEDLKGWLLEGGDGTTPFATRN